MTLHSFIILCLVIASLATSFTIVVLRKEIRRLQQTIDLIGRNAQGVGSRVEDLRDIYRERISDVEGELDKIKEHLESSKKSLESIRNDVERLKQARVDND